MKPLIRDNIALNANPQGCKENIKNQINQLKELPMIDNKPKNVLVIGGSSGYGLSSRIALTYKANAYTYSVSFEKEPKGNRQGSAGYYNNLAFEEISKEDGYASDMLNADCFAHGTKEQVVRDFKAMGKTIDLVVYSVASGIRIDPDTNERYVSSLKPLNTPFSGYTIDIARETLKVETLEPASTEEVENTVRVMGGADYVLWAKALFDNNVLSENCTFVTYTYLGSDITHPIYKDGTIGQAKRDLEASTSTINELLKPLHGQAIISASKAVVTKASVFIPTMALYASALFKVMKQRGTHESVVQHKYRLFHDMIYGSKPIIDAAGIYRLDAQEMDPETQALVQALLQEVTEDNFKERVDFEAFKREFNSINGFNEEY